MTGDREEMCHLLDRVEERLSVTGNVVRLVMKDGTEHVGQIIAEKNHSSGGAPWTYGGDISLNLGGIDARGIFRGNRVEVFDLLDVAHIETAHESRRCD